MGTVATISAYGESVSHANYAIARVYDEFRRLDKLLSLYKAESLVQRLNQSAGREEIAVAPEFLALLDSAAELHRKTRGAFDVTIEPLMELWGFRSEERWREFLPSDREIAARLEAVGFQHIKLNRTRRTVGLTHRLSSLDFGGIAVGYAVDRAVAILRSEGVESAFINHSGDAFALGTPDDADGWMVGIPNPLNPVEIAHSFSINNQAVSTSGNYENFIRVNDARFGHILSPFSGKPSDALMSATVVAETALAADALSTGLFCLGLERSKSVLAETPGIQLLAITPDDHTFKASILPR